MVTLLNYMEKKFPRKNILFNTFVNTIQYTNDGVNITAITHDPKTDSVSTIINYRARYSIVTLPIGVLKKEIVNFIPELPLKKKKNCY